MMESERTTLAGAQDGAHTQCSVRLTNMYFSYRWQHHCSTLMYAK